MISGLGNDIIEIERIARSVERYGSHFLDRIFTDVEQKYCLQHTNAAERFAGRFAAKEAVAKALGTGLGKELSWTDIVIERSASGKPTVALSDTAKQHFGDPVIMLSISHCKAYANAVAIVVER